MPDHFSPSVALQPPDPVPAPAGRARRSAQWIGLLFGAAMLVAVIAAAVHFTEQRTFVRLIHEAEPWWLAMAVLLQAGTYAAQGGVWRVTGAATGHPMSRVDAFRLSLVKLFADQALPSGGISSSVLVAKVLHHDGLPAASANASVLLNIASYHLAYLVALAAALSILFARHEAHVLVLLAAALFLLFSLGISGTVMALPGRRHRRLGRMLAHVPGARRLLIFVSDADPRFVRPGALSAAILWQSAIVLLDASTVWFLLRALGRTASPTGVFASFMMASLVRTMGVVPGGLGTFEASSVMMLRLTGVDLAAALSATLLFRGLSFWLPMLPGYWLSRRALAEDRPEAAVPSAAP